MVIADCSPRTSAAAASSLAKQHFLYFFPRITSYNVCYTKLLRKQYPDAAGAAVSRGFLGDPGDQRRVALEALPSQVGQAIRMNVGEWLLFDAELSIDGQSRRALELVV